MQAFTFGLAAARWDSRRQVVLDEVNAIGTTYLRAAMLPDPHGSNVRVLLREYVEVRLERLEQPNAQVGDIIRKSEKLHTKLWAEAVKAARTDNSDITALFVDSLNQVIDLHTKRVTAGIRGRVPATIWGALIFLSIVGAFGLGHHAGLAGSSRSVAGLGMVLSFVVVMWLIADLDRPLEEMLRVNQQAMVDLRETMKNDAP